MRFPKYFLLSFFVGSVFLIGSAKPVFAARIIDSVTLNGSSSVTVAPSASITAVVNVTTTSSGGANWQGTSWTVNGVTTCVNTPNHNGVGSYSESFSITAPASTGVFNAVFIAYANNACSTTPSSTYTLTNGITVVSPTPTPTNTPTPTPLPTMAAPVGSCNSGNIVFTWSSQPGAIDYWVQVYDQGLPQTWYYNTWTGSTTPSLTLGTVPAGTTVYAKVAWTNDASYVNVSAFSLEGSAFCPVPTATNTPTPTFTPTPTHTPTPTNTPTNTPTSTPTPTNTPTSTPTPTPVPPTRTPTVTPTHTPIPTPTETPAPTSIPTFTPTPTDTPPPGATDTPTLPPGVTPTSQPGATDTLVSTQSPTGLPAVTYYPSVHLNAFSPNPTNKIALAYSGSATIEQGSIKRVEYSITGGAEWLSAQLSGESFSFATPPLSEGTHTIVVRALSAADVYTQSGSYASDTVTIITTPPQVTLNKFEQNPTNDTTPTTAGTIIPAAGTVVRVEVTLDKGTTWLPASFSDRTFSFTTEQLEDNNYTIAARAVDNAGNVGTSNTQTLIVDTIPPIIGGGVYTLGPQPLLPTSNGVVSVVAGAQTSIAMSMKGGVTEAKVMTDDGSFPLAIQPGTTQWVGTIDFKSPGDKQLVVSAVDGAGNETTRPFSTIHSEPFGTIKDTQTNMPIQNASITLYVFETTSKQWIRWDAASYGQKNPQHTILDGAYSFFVPAGTYYIEAAAPGYHTVQSEELSVVTASIINGTLPMQSAPALRFTVPVLGPLVLSIPSFLLPPDTVSSAAFGVHTAPLPQPADSAVNTPVRAFSIPDLSGNTISPDQFTGKRWVLSFLAPWSPLSQEQAPLLSALSGQLSQDQTMLAILLQESVATSNTFLKKGHYTFPAASDSTGKTAQDYQVAILPYHVFIDTNGIIRETYTGVLTPNEILDRLSRLP